MGGVNFGVKITGMDAAFRNLERIPDELKRGQALKMAINKVEDKAAAEARRQIAQRFAIKANDVRSSIVLRRATLGAAGQVSGSIEIFGSPTKRGRSMNMVRFLAAVQAAGQAMKTRGTQANKKQLAALGAQLGFVIKRGGGLKTIPGAFLGNHGRTVFGRIAGTTMASRSRYGGTKHAEQIKPIQVVGVAQMFNTRVIRGQVLAKIRADLDIEVARAVEKILAKIR